MWGDCLTASYFVRMSMVSPFPQTASKRFCANLNTLWAVYYFLFKLELQTCGWSILVCSDHSVFNVTLAASFPCIISLSLWWLNPESLACSVTTLPLSFYHHSASLPAECCTGNTGYFCQSLHLMKMCGSDPEVDMIMSDLLFFILRELSSQTQTSFPKYTIATN